MKSVIRHLPRGMFAGVVVALQPIVASLLVVAAGAEENSGPQWFAQVFEPLPRPIAQTESKESVPEACQPAPQDLPLSTLTTDIRPRDHEGQVVAGDALPVDCAQYVFTEERFASFDLSCESCRPRWRDVLQLAHFCHRPLYFEEALLERCGVRSCCCQPAASAVHFYGTALLMPVYAICQCPCTTCVPAQFCL